MMRHGPRLRVAEDRERRELGLPALLGATVELANFEDRRIRCWVRPRQPRHRCRSCTDDEARARSDRSVRLRRRTRVTPRVRLVAPAAQFGADGKLAPPVDYRHWTFLTSGLGMTYGPLAAAPNSAPNFDSVFVDPRSYDQFVATGTWREGAIFAVEVRASERAPARSSTAATSRPTSRASRSRSRMASGSRMAGATSRSMPRSRPRRP